METSAAQPAPLAPKLDDSALRAAFLRDRLLRQAPPAPLPGSGILYAEDFDQHDEVPEIAAAAVAPAAEQPLLTEANLAASRAAAYADGFDSAHREMMAAREQSRLASMQAIADALAAARGSEEACAQHHASETARLLLALLSAALPATMAKYAELEARSFAANLLPLLRHEAELHMRAHPDRLPILLEAAQDAALKIVPRADPAMAPTEFELRWAGGEARTAPRQFWAMLGAALAPLDLPSLQELCNAE